MPSRALSAVGVCCWCGWSGSADAPPAHSSRPPSSQNKEEGLLNSTKVHTYYSDSGYCIYTALCPAAFELSSNAGRTRARLYTTHEHCPGLERRHCTYHLPKLYCQAGVFNWCAVIWHGGLRWVTLTEAAAVSRRRGGLRCCTRLAVFKYM